jgi:Ni/Co efflux regulator RcnB
MKKFIVGAIALSVLATAGMANAQPGRNDHNGPQGHQGPQYGHQAPQNHFEPDRRADHHFKGKRYKAPRGYQARSFHRGEQLPSAYRSKSYVVNYHTYGLRAPPRGYQYVRVNNDVVLTAITTGIIASVISELFN